MSQASDSELLHQHVAGDRDAFASLVTRHRDRLWALAVRTLGDREEAADAVQDALVKAFRSAEQFRGDAAVTTWLHRIVVNACLDRARRRAARARAPLADDDHLQVPAQAAGENPAVGRERRVDVLAALQQLPADQRAAVVLVDMEGYAVEEAAAILDCAPGTVKSRCARGRRRLVPLLSAWNQDEAGRVRPGVSDRHGTEGGAPDGR